MATLALFAFPLFALAVFARLGVARGLIWSVGIGYLFLPDGYNIILPLGLPPYGKWEAVALGAVLGVLIFSKGGDSKRTNGDPIVWMLLLGLTTLLVLSEFGTWITNTGSTVMGGGVVAQGLSVRDAVTGVMNHAIKLIPMLLGLMYLRTAEHRIELLRAIVILGVVYTPLMIIELVMSPQMSVWVYNHFPHSWQQHLRGGGYRPLVFLRHGLWLGWFMVMAVLSAAILVRADPKRRLLWLAMGAWLLLILLISRNLGAAMLALAGLPMVLLIPSALQARIAMVLAAFYLAYPALVQNDLSPERTILNFSQGINVSRASSLEHRLNNEKMFLERVALKPLFGWGGWGRSRVFNEFGRDVSTVDGFWIGVFSTHGWAGYIGLFGLLTVPVMALGRAARRHGKMDPAASGMGIILGLNFIYILPNSAFNPLGYVMAGAIAAYVMSGKKAEDTDETPAAAGPEPTRGQTYTRFNGPRRQVGARVPSRAVYSRRTSE